MDPKTPVVFLHAFPLSSKMWKGETEFFSGKVPVFTVDLPGFGSAASQDAPSVAVMARQVAARLDALALPGPVFLAGLSMGGYVAFEFLRQFPERVAGLGLFATRASADSDDAKKNRSLAIEAIEKFGVEPFARKAVKSQLGKTTQEQNPALIETVLGMMREASVKGTVSALKAMAARRDSNDLLPSISFPVLVVAGEEDTIAPAEEMRRMHEKIPSSEFRIIPKAGHLVNMEAPQVFRSILSEFLFAKISSR